LPSNDFQMNGKPRISTTDSKGENVTIGRPPLRGGRNCSTGYPGFYPGYW